MNVIGCQWDLAWEDKQENFRRLRTLLAQASIAPRSLIVLPEMFATGFSMNVEGIAEEAHGPTVDFLAGLAREFGSFIIGGRVTRAADGRGLNEAIVLSPEGRVIERYHKLHPFSYGGESQHYAPGGALTLFEWGGLKVAVFICYDLRFPEAFRLAVQAGAQALVVIANWPAAREQHWTTLLQARAIENQAYVVGVNRVGSDPRLSYSGRSLIIDPRGRMMADGGTEEGLITAELNVDAVVQYQREFPVLADLRPELLGGLP
jgi:omega-amidase